MQKFIDFTSFKNKYIKLFVFILFFFLSLNLFAKEECKLLKREKIDLNLEANPICSKFITLKNKSNYLVAKMVGVEALNANLYLEKEAGKEFIQISKSESENTSTESIDLDGLDDGKYRVCAIRGATGIMHLGTDSHLANL